MLDTRTFLIALLVWMGTLGTVVALPGASLTSASTSRPEPIEVEPETLTLESGPTTR